MALEAVAIATKGPTITNRQYVRLRLRCKLYTKATRALYRTRAELLVQGRREIRHAVRVKKTPSRRATPNEGPFRT